MEQGCVLKDNLQFMHELPKHCIDLIYTDILYGTGTKFSHYTDLPYDPSFIKNFYKPRISEMFRVLKPGGSIYIHLDWHVSHIIRQLLDETFGFKSFRNEIIRRATNSKNMSTNWGRIHDKILYYVKPGASYTWNPVRIPRTISHKSTHVEESTGREYVTTALHAPGRTKTGDTGKPWCSDNHGIIPLPDNRHWRYNRKMLTELDRLGRIHWSKNDNPRLKKYIDEDEGILASNIWDIRNTKSLHATYSTEKPIQIASRIIQASSNESEWVFDPFCGAGSCLVAAKLLNRKYLGCDINTQAVKQTNEKLDNHESYRLYL